MSYGWLTESSLLPKKSKPISIGEDGGIFGLKAALAREKEKAKEGQGRKIYEIKKPPKGATRNKGVEERMKRDEEEQTPLTARGKDMVRSLQTK